MTWREYLMAFNDTRRGLPAEMKIGPSLETEGDRHDPKMRTRRVTVAEDTNPDFGEGMTIKVNVAGW
jgi:hypothetical protein